MTQRSALVFDAAASLEPSAAVPLLNAEIAGVQFAGAPDWSVNARRLRGGLSDGVDVVDLCNGPLTVSILPTRGMGIWRARYRDLPIGWDSPVKLPVHPRHVDQSARNGLGWLDGFNELICRCGLSSNGPPGIDDGAASPIESQLTLHGRIANLPAHRVEASVDDNGRGTISVAGTVDESTLFGPQLRLTSTVSTEAGSHSFTVTDEITNLAAHDCELQLLYHINIGSPFLTEGSQLHTAVRAMAPRDGRAAEDIDTSAVYLGPTPGYAEQVYLYDLLADASQHSTVLLTDAAGAHGLGLRFDRSQLPCFTQWKCTQAMEDGYVTGLEPATNYPNFKSFEREQGRVISLAPGQTYTTSLSMEVFTTPADIAAAAERIASLQQEAACKVHRAPTPPFSAQ